LRWRGGLVGRLAPGERLLAPRVEPLASDFVEGEARERVRQRLAGFVKGEIERCLAPLSAVRDLELEGAARGLAFQLVEALGLLPAAEVAPLAAALAAEDRARLRRAGLRFGRHSLYLEPLLKPEAMRFRALLWAVANGRPVPSLPGARRLRQALPVDPALPASFYRAIGMVVLGGFAVPADRLERLGALAWRQARAGPFAAGPELAAAGGVDSGSVGPLLAALGYRRVVEAGGEHFVWPRRRRSAAERPRQRAGDGHPFAKLHQLKLA